MKGFGETNKRSDDPISEAIKILEDTSSPGKAKTGTENTTHPAKDDRTKEVQSDEHKGKAIETENAEIDRSENMSSEQSFWFRLAKSDKDETK